VRDSIAHREVTLNAGTMTNSERPHTLPFQLRLNLRIARRCPQIPRSRGNTLCHNPVPVPEIDSEKVLFRKSPAGRAPDSTSSVPFDTWRQIVTGRAGPVRQLAASSDRPPRKSVGSVCSCEQLAGTSASYARSEEHDHECKPSPHGHPSASTSGEKAGQAARADCGSTSDRTGCARSKGAANVFTIPLDDEREIASSGGLAP
jgi:hypothetical protein